ncbi:MAG: hypothetical protein ABSG51_16360 [Terracidiphilus sp.]|jgi:hypothetical protein
MRLPAAVNSLCLFILCLSFSITANAAIDQPDQVLLKNGDRLSGRVLSASDASLDLSTDYAGTITIARASIGQVVPGKKETVQPALATPSAAASTLNQSVAKPSFPCRNGLIVVPDSWSFSLRGTPDKVVLGTTSQEQFGADLDLDICEGSMLDKTHLNASGSHVRTYKEKSTAIETDTDRAELDQRHSFKSPSGLALYGVGYQFTNNSLGMAMERSAGIGLLSPQFSHKLLYYDFAVDVRYVSEHLDHSSPALNLAAVRVRQQMNTVGTKTFSWNEQAWVMPTLNNIHALQAFGAVGPSLAIKKWLTLGVNEEEDYLGNAPKPNRKNYFASTLTLTIKSASGSNSK